MESLFAAQPTGFSPVDGFTPAVSLTQQAQLLGQALDQSHYKNLQRFPRQALANQVPKFISRHAAKYIIAPQSPTQSIQASINPITAFQRIHRAPTSGEMAVKSLEINGRAGEESAKLTLQYVRTAMSLASRASEAQFEAAKIGPGLTAIHNNAFPLVNNTPNAPPFLAAFGKFMEPEELRGSLLTYRGQEGVMDEVMEMMYHNALQPGKSLVALAGLTKDSASRIAQLRTQAARQINFMKSLPYYKNVGYSSMSAVSKVSKQHRTMNGFKPRSNDRFLAI